MKKVKVARADDQEEFVDVYSIYEFEDAMDKLNKYWFTRPINQYKNKKTLFYPLFADTETAHNHDEKNRIGWIYQWAVKVDNVFFGGRTPKEFITLLKNLDSFYQLDDSRQCVIYIHNLSYDAQYLLPYLYEEDADIEILALRAHKILQIKWKHYLIKCSYLLSNRSLAKWCENTNALHIKAIGAIDYDVIRYQDSELTDADWYYMISDVYSMSDCFEVEKGTDFDVTNIPLTSTGFVRYDMRKEFAKDKKNRDGFNKSKLNPITYSILNRAYAGGYTHGNRAYSGLTLKNVNVRHRDFRSFFPSIIEKQYMPEGSWALYFDRANHNKKLDIAEYEKLCDEYCVIADIYVNNCIIKKDITDPILSLHKCWQGRQTELDYVVDNGRVLTLSGVTKLAFTELDYFIFKEQYEGYELYIDKVYIAKRGKSPDWLRKVSKDYFFKKTVYKERVKKEKDKLKKINLALELMKSKNKLNGIYGCTATNPIREEVHMSFKDGKWSTSQPVDIEQALKKYYNSRNSFMNYAIGVYTTSWSRYILTRMIKDIVGYENFLYCDTDSLFYLSTPEIEQKFDNWNRQNLRECIEGDHYITDDDGSIIEYMTFEDEDEDITDFKFLHSKCYAYVEDGHLHSTIAGVTAYYREDMSLPADKRRTREDELGSIDELRHKKKFTHCGGVACAYTHAMPHTEWIDGHQIDCASAAIIYDVDKTLSEIISDFSQISFTPIVQQHEK